MNFRICERSYFRLEMAKVCWKLLDYTRLTVNYWAQENEAESSPWTAADFQRKPSQLPVLFERSCVHVSRVRLTENFLAPYEKSES